MMLLRIYVHRWWQRACVRFGASDAAATDIPAAHHFYIIFFIGYLLRLRPQSAFLPVITGIFRIFSMIYFSAYFYKTSSKPL